MLWFLASLKGPFQCSFVGQRVLVHGELFGAQSGVVGERVASRIVFASIAFHDRCLDCIHCLIVQV